jgi:hypothetical protein
VIHYTAGYGVAYADADTALTDIASVTQQAAQTVSDALARGGIAPPNAADLAAAVVRVSSLETSRTADENRLTALEGKTTRTPTQLTLSASFAPYGIAPFTEGAGLTAWKDAQSNVRIVGLLKPAAAIGTTAGVAILSAAGLPAGFRPPAAPGGAAQTFIRYVPQGGGPGVAVGWHRVSITSAGVMTFEASAALAVGNTPLQFDLTYSTAN